MPRSACADDGALHVSIDAVDRRLVMSTRARARRASLLLIREFSPEEVGSANFGALLLSEMRALQAAARDPFNLHPFAAVYTEEGA